MGKKASAKKGLRWWDSAPAAERDVVVEQRLDQGMTCEQIRADLGLPSKNYVVGVRTRIKTRRKKNGVSMATWSKRPPPKPAVARRAKKVQSHVCLSKLLEARRAAIERLFLPPPLPFKEEDVPAGPETMPNPYQKKYGKSTHLSCRELHRRGYEEPADMHGKRSAFPAPSEELPADAIRFLMAAYG